jgi:predicted nucleotidyltransferase
MLKNYNRYKVLKIFLNSPTETFRLRELSRLSGISPLSVANYLKELEEEGILTRFEKNRVPFYKAMRDNEKFRLYQKISTIYELEESGLIDEIWYALSPDAIILYGSFSKGDAIETSDVDLFIIGKEKKIDLSKYENKLGREIHLMFKQDIKKVPNELRNNLINGIVLKGYLKVF